MTNITGNFGPANFPQPDIAPASGPAVGGASAPIATPASLVVPMPLQSSGSSTKFSIQNNPDQPTTVKGCADQLLALLGLPTEADASVA